MLNFKWSIKIIQIKIIPVLICSLFLNALQVTDLWSVGVTPPPTPACSGIDSVYDATLEACVYCIGNNGDTGCTSDHDCCAFTSCDTTTKTCILTQQTENTIEYVAIGVVSAAAAIGIGIALYVMLNGTPRKVAYQPGDSAETVAANNGFDPDAAAAAVAFVGDPEVTTAVAVPGQAPGIAYDQYYFADLKQTGAISVAPDEIVSAIVEAYPALPAGGNPANTPSITLATQNFNRDILVPRAQAALKTLIASRDSVPFDSIEGALAADSSNALARVLVSNSALLSVNDNFVNTIKTIDPDGTIFSAAAKARANQTVSTDLANALKGSVLAPVTRDLAEWQTFKQACSAARSINNVDMVKLALALSGDGLDVYSPAYDNQMADGFARAKILLKSMPFADADGVIQPVFDDYGNYSQVLHW
jgi:hypothetical protein